MKFDLNGNLIWATSEGSDGVEFANSIFAGVDTFYYLTGYFGSPYLAIGSDTLFSNLGADYFVAKFDSSGNPLWARGAVSIANGTEYGNKVVADPQGYVYTCGTYTGPDISFDSVAFSSGLTQMSTDIFLVKYHPSGNVLWVDGAGGDYYDLGNALALSPSGGIFMGGHTQSSTISFGTHILFNSGGTDYFIAESSNYTPAALDPLHENEFDAVIFPNPTEGKFQIKSLKPLTEIEISDITGHVIEKIALRDTRYEINLPGPGVYLVTVSSGQFQKTTKLICAN
jgi:hypothetical protein